MEKLEPKKPLNEIEERKTFYMGMKDKRNPTVFYAESKCMALNKVSVSQRLGRINIEQGACVAPCQVVWETRPQQRRRRRRWPWPRRGTTTRAPGHRGEAPSFSSSIQVYLGIAIEPSRLCIKCRTLLAFSSRTFWLSTSRGLRGEKYRIWVSKK